MSTLMRALNAVQAQVRWPMEDIALAHKALFVAKEGAGIKNAWEALSSRHRSPDKNLTPPKPRQVRFFLLSWANSHKQGEENPA